MSEAGTNEIPRRSEEATLQRVVETYFSDPKRTNKLSKGQVLMEQDHLNDRLYLVQSGRLAGYVRTAEGSLYELFKASNSQFVGVISFFSRSYRAASTVVAEEETLVAYISEKEARALAPSPEALYEQLMPVVITNLAERQMRELETAMEKERALKMLIQTEKLASLGQMSAGLAHELNNAIAVLERGTEWLCKTLDSAFRARHPAEARMFQHGLQDGREVSTSDIRKKAKQLEKSLSIGKDLSRKLIEMNLDEEQMKTLLREANVESSHFYWNVGATFHGMLLASRHATYVVNSVKALGAQKLRRDTEQDPNESIREALALLSSPLRSVNVEAKLSQLPMIKASKGELVQVWSNLIKNAYESITQAGTEEPAITVRSYCRDEIVHVEIEDNGPGIPEEILPRIFQPNVSTKAEGLRFGLGLGLAIVERIVSSYGGKISVESVPGSTIFTVQLPTGE